MERLKKIKHLDKKFNQRQGIKLIHLLNHARQFEDIKQLYQTMFGSIEYVFDLFDREECHKYEHIDNIYIAFAIRRTGQHAILEWLRKSFENDTVFYNNVHKFDASPHSAAHDFFLNDMWIKLRTYLIVEDKLPKKLSCLVANYENFNIENFNEKVLKKNIQKLTESYDNLKVIMVLRDGFNTMASEYKNNGGKVKLDKELWKKYAREFLSETTNIPGVIKVNYNEWVKNNTYKKEIFKKCGGNDYIENFNFISECGGGSSFEKDAKSFDEIGVKKVLSRWEFLLDKKELGRMLKDKEFVELNEKIYGKEFVDEIREKWMKKKSQ